MTFTIHTITAKNFLSIGNVTQSIKFDQPLTLILGENLDLGGDDAGSRNGVGKTALLNALSYALYGQALTNIRKENLINATNGRNLLVTVEFSKNNIHYRIERGRKPNVLKFFVNNQEQKVEDDDDSQGDSRETQKDIDQLLGMSHTMFKHLVALNTYSEPFLAMRTADQREVIEQLLGITLLSEKAESLKLLIKTTKDQIQEETFRIEGIKSANENVQKSIDSLIIKSNAWETKKNNDLEKLGKAIMQLEDVDIEKEIVLHNDIKLWDENNKILKDLTKQRATFESAQSQALKSVKKYQKELELLADQRCHACDQHLQGHKHKELLEKTQQDLLESQTYYDKITKDLDSVNKKITNIGQQPKKPITFYDTLEEALSHKNNLANLEKDLLSKSQEQNPYDEQISELKLTAIQEINWNEVNKLTKIRDHQEFLHKLLTNKDSFIRKKIIDQNLSYLNKRLTYYIDKIGLPHQVIFQNDLTVTITQLGQDLDFDNLSRGERNRLILSLSFAFRDVWENLYQHINLLFVDELLDSGMDAAGIESGLAILKKMARDRNKNIYLISHRDDLIGRVDNILRVVKENGFTSYDSTEQVAA